MSHFRFAWICVTAVFFAAVEVNASVLRDRLAEAHEGFLEERRESLASLSDPFGAAPAARVVIERPGRGGFHGQYAWKRNVVATIFWVGEQPTPNNPTPNHMSA